jgi:AbrB family looped-hinge helix DNA binding protein
MIKVVNVNQRGALTLPKEARKKLGVSRGGQLAMEVNEKGEIVFRPAVVMPVEMYSDRQIEEFRRMNETPLETKKLRWRNK